MGGVGGGVVDGLCSGEGEMYSSRRASATAGIANEKLVGNVCMNAVGQLARGERKRREEARKSAGTLIVQICLERARMHARTHSNNSLPAFCLPSISEALCDFL